MNPKLMIKKVISTSLMVSLVAVYSMVALASTDSNTGKLTIKGKNNIGVLVNGEKAENGQAISSSSTVVTSDDAGAIINIGKIGSIELEPGTNLNILFNETNISGELVKGKITVLNSTEKVNIMTANGKFKKLNAGESVATMQDDDDDDDDDGGGYVWLGLGVFGAAVAGAIIAVYSDDDSDLNIAGTGLNFSPTR